MYRAESIRNIESGLRQAHVVKGDCLVTIDELMKTTATTALSVAVIEDLELKWLKGYGFTDTSEKVAVDENTLFQAASISKSLSALAVMKLVDEGKLNLDSNVNDYLRSWKLEENELTKETEVTLRLLLSHTAGTSVSGFPGYNKAADIPSLLEVLEGCEPSNTGRIKVITKPGTVYRYSGGGTTILQQVLIDQLGMNFEDLMKEMVLEPLGMGNSFFSASRLSEEDERRISKGYDSEANMIDGGYHVYPEMAAAGLWTTAEDLAKFVMGMQKALRNEPDAILSQRYALEMVKPIASGEYALGFEQFTILDEKLLGHTGSNAGYKASLYFHASKGYGFVLMTNSDEGYQIKMPLLRSIAYERGWHDLLNPEYEKQETTGNIIERILGRYRVSVDESLRIYMENEEVYCKSFGSKLSVMTYIGDNRFIDSERKALLSVKGDDVYLNDKKIVKLGIEERLPLDHIEENNVDMALQCYRKLMEQGLHGDLNIERRLCILAMNLKDEDKLSLAIEVLEVATELFPSSGICFDIIGHYYFKDKQYRKSLEALEQSKIYKPLSKESQQMIEHAKQVLND